MLATLALVAGLLLPWTLGAACIASLHAGRRADSVPVAWVLGCGWFAGMFLLTLLMRGVALAGVPFSLASVGLPLLGATVLAGWLAWRLWAARTGVRTGDALRNTLRALGGGDLVGWRRIAWRLLLGWLALRYALLLAELWLQPLYPWDAWTQWSTKARTWYDTRTLVPFVGVDGWLQGVPAGAYMDAAPHYPATVPLFQTWAALLLGGWDDAHVNLPFWISGVAFVVAFYGALRRFAFEPMIALAGAALLATLPILNVHVALAGYADLPMAAYLTLGTVAALLAITQRSWPDALLALLLLAAGVLVKNPGKAWLVVLVPGLLVAAWPRRGLMLASIAFAAATLAMLLVAQRGINVLGYQISAKYAMPWNALFDAYFSFANWNLLFYALVAAAIAARRQLFSPAVAPLTSIVIGGLMFLYFGFAFTNAAAWVEDQSTVNRATLHLVPLMILWMLVALRAWRTSTRARADAAGTLPPTVEPVRAPDTAA